MLGKFLKQTGLIFLEKIIMEKATFATFFFIFFLLEICNAQKCNQSLPFYDSRNNCTAACPSSHRYNLA